MTSKNTKIQHKKLNVLHIATEVQPFSNVGGLSNVIGYLSKYTRRRGHEVRIFMPKFGFIDEKKYPMEYVKKGLRVPTGYTQKERKPSHLICNVKKLITEDKVQVYFLENMEYYERRSNVYSYSDDYVRWALLSYGALKYFYKNSSWKPDVIHVHDWHSALVPNIIKTKYKKKEYFDDIATVLTIHNINFQGQSVDPNSELNYDDGKSEIPPLFSARLKTLNYLKRGILFSDVVNTVSEGYARQILTKKYGAGLDKLLLELRSKLFGIVNGMDYEKFNPETDPLLVSNFNVKTTEKRVINKEKLQKEFGLKVDANVPLIAYSGRIDWQKGVDLIIEVLERFLRNFEAQFVLVGTGDRNIEKKAEKLAHSYESRVGVHLYANFTLPRLVFGGSDIVLMPSRFEPCGLVQMEAMRYGAIPVVRATGGLDDTVEDYNPATGKGNGFKFKDFDGWSLYGQLVRAIETYRDKKTWAKIQKNAMEADFSWNQVTTKYEDLYKKAMLFKKDGYVHGALIE